MKKYIVALSLFLSLPAFAQNYQATQGAGTTFGTKLVGGVNYPQFVLCDPTTPAQCVVVDSSGRMTLAPNQSVNNAQINGVAPLMGNGVTGTGSQRVTIASDNTAFSVNAVQSGTWTTRVVGNAGAVFDGATAAAVPANVLYNGINIGGNLAGLTGLATGATVKAATVAIVDASGNQITAFGGSGGTASNFGSAFPSSGTAVGFTDGTNMQPGRLKAASTAPAATDPSIVVTTSPNSPDATFLGAQADSACGTATGTCSLAALVKFLNTAATSAIPAGSALIGDVNVRQGGTALSTTNGLYSNLLQGNAVLSATNGLYFNQLQGNAALSATNGIFANCLLGNAACATGTGAQGATSQRVTVAIDSATVAGSASLPAGTNSIGTVRGDVNVTPTDCSGTVTTGGTAQNAFTSGATKRGFTIMNFDTTEPMWISFTTTAAANTIASYPIPAATATTFAGAGSFTSPPGMGINTALSVIAATTGHKWSCTWW